MSFKKYNRDDIHKYAKIILKKCGKDKIDPDKSYEEKLDLICDVLKDYDYFKNLAGEYGTIDYIINAIDECEKQSKLECYNLGNKSV